LPSKPFWSPESVNVSEPSPTGERFVAPRGAVEKLLHLLAVLTLPNRPERA